MRTLGYFAVWIALILATLLQLVIFGGVKASNLRVISIMVLAWLQASLVVFFYQNVLKEPKGVSMLYLASFLTGSGLIIGMILSITHAME
ncbi:MAG: hypothetical protein QXX95_01350 [Nitrososphaerales archaeon]